MFTLCYFGGLTPAEYLGHIISRKGLEMAPSKIDSFCTPSGQRRDAAMARGRGLGVNPNLRTRHN